MLATPAVPERRFHDGFACPRCRHRVMAQLAPAEPALSGIVEADETVPPPELQAVALRGSADAEARHRGGQPAWARGRDKVPVLIARNRAGATRAVVFPGTATTEALTAALRGVVDLASALCTDGSGALRAAERSACDSRSPRGRPGRAVAQDLPRAVGQQLPGAAQTVARAVPGRGDEVPAPLSRLARHPRARTAPLAATSRNMKHGTASS